ncbi:hypothetical protein HJG54_16310 [Leptolyngbya sp. NK1-12]|uniref:Uncharacterized protein n=1 Tax=Leptolyngbya sp. NK1-12 TaxID=2547451 RepID=A0AA96WFU0_9CYAN|nr:hypothetical protein [Leptolyngbya sp. NK1-12]WNZ24264.1 hypothetical protein HJG54_16310 [Leptolyngbya sp. NK1-12]
MNDANHDQVTNPQPSSSEAQDSEIKNNRLIDPRELVYRGGYSGDPREIVENPAVAPEMVEQAPEDLRDDLMPKEKSEDE